MRFRTLITETLLLEKFIPEFSYHEVGDIFNSTVKILSKGLEKDEALNIKAAAFSVVYSTPKWQRFRDELVQFADGEYGLTKFAKANNLKSIDKNTAYKFCKTVNDTLSELLKDKKDIIKSTFTEELKKAITEKTKQTELDI